MVKTNKSLISVQDAARRVTPYVEIASVVAVPWAEAAFIAARDAADVARLEAEADAARLIEAAREAAGNFSPSGKPPPGGRSWQLMQPSRRPGESASTTPSPA